MINTIVLKLGAKQPPPKLMLEASAVFERAFAEQAWEFARVEIKPEPDALGWYHAEVSARPKLAPGPHRYQMPAEGDTT